MELKEFKDYINSFPEGTTFEFGISEPFSWRGVYAEVAFEILDVAMTREKVLEHIELAYTETFHGYKGGNYTYNDHTDIHFEEDDGSWSDGGYVSRWIANIEDKEPIRTQEERFVKLAFNIQ